MNAAAILGLAILAAAVPTAVPTSGRDAVPTRVPTSMTTTTISGAFDVKMTPQGSAHEAAQIGRFSLDKTYHGDLEATSLGEMIAVRTAQEGSAGYVAIERVTGTLAGRKGTFALQHSATMDRGTPSLTIVVIPDSGTDGLIGLTGTMGIRIEPGGKHFYDFTYALPAAATAR
jgi:hypothetical protein